MFEARQGNRPARSQHQPQQHQRRPAPTSSWSTSISVANTCFKFRFRATFMRRVSAQEDAELSSEAMLCCKGGGRR